MELLMDNQRFNNDWILVNQNWNFLKKYFFKRFQICNSLYEMMSSYVYSFISNKDKLLLLPFNNNFNNI